MTKKWCFQSKGEVVFCEAEQVAALETRLAVHRCNGDRMAFEVRAYSGSFTGGSTLSKATLTEAGLLGVW